MIALYKFRFYELDQPLEVGAEQEFVFFVDPHYAAIPSAPIQADTVLVFANTLAGPSIVSHPCRITSIEHPQLGSIHSAATSGLDYIVTLQNGHTLVVNAEEYPGRIENGTVQVADWAFIVNVEPIDSSEVSQ
jgi:hypothetical protein